MASMALMAATAVIISNPTPLAPPPRLLNSSSKPLRFTSISHQHRARFSVPVLASSLSIPSINVDYLKTEFSGHGVSFEGIGDSCVVKMRMENGSVASLMLPSGLITSYKPYMWHGATFEVLHTTVSEGESGEAVVQGGVSMDFKIAGEDSLTPGPLSSWSLSSVRGSPRDSIEVELVSVSPENMGQVKCLITLQEDSIGSELIIANPHSSALELSGSFISHLKVSTPDATYAVGLQGSNYRSKQPLTSDFCIIPPDLNRRSSAAPKSVLQHLLFRWGSNKGEDEDGEPNYDGFSTAAEESEGEEDDDQASMTEKMSRVYTSAPRQFTIIDRGRRNSVVIGRSGFDEVYVFSPGSEHEWYGNYAYVCVGPSAKLKPVVLAPGGIWRGAQYLHNPNL